MAKKNTKGLFLDTAHIDQPENTYPYGKNGIQDFRKSAVINEPGFLLSSANIPYTHMGTIETDHNPIIFSTDDTNSAIGFFDPDNDTYTPIFNDSSLSFKLGFKKVNYITGEYQKDHTGAYIAVFTDKVTPLRYINCTTPNITKLEDMLFFLRAASPQLTPSVESGGQLLTGAYLFYIKYARIDGSETPYIATSAPIVVSGSDGSGTSSSSIRISLSGCDTSYDFAIVSVLIKVSGVTTAVQLSPISISPNMDILYTGNNTTIPITIDELLIPPAVYSTVGTLCQLNDTLFLGNLQQTPEFIYQKYASMIQVRFVSQSVDMTNIPTPILSGLKKGFAHGETYALYIRLRMKDGSKSRAYTIPGRAPVSGEQNTVTDGGITAKSFQLHDTPLYVNTIDRSGTPGLWVNQTETYPDTAEFDSSSMGGENFRGQSVRHHKMPTHRWIKKNFENTNLIYGKDTLDILGIKLSNIIIPAVLQPYVDSYEILYAERTTANATVLGQSEVLFAAQDLALTLAGSPNNFQSTGGNWNTVASIFAYRDVNKASDRPLHVVGNRIRMHPFELLFNRIELPATGCYLQFEWKMRQDNILGTGVVSYGVDTAHIGPSSRKASDILPVVYLLNSKGSPYITITPTADADFIRGFSSIQYAHNNINTGEWNNIEVETSVVGKLISNAPPINVSSQNVAVGDHQMKLLNTNGYVQFEETFLGTLRVLKGDIYDSFLSQSLVSTGVTFSPNLVTTTEIYAGDTFPCDYTVNNYGWVSADDGLTGAGQQNLAGTKVMRRFICESIANINQRYEIPGNIYSQWTPHNTVAPLNAYIMQFDRSQDPNQFGYSKDLNTLNNFESITVYNPFTQVVYSFPYRIARGGKFKREGYPTSWRTLLALDYYDMPKNRGVIINLAGLDDNLLVHHESALFITQDKTTLQGDVLKVILGAGDIFQYAPLEGLGTKLGYAGTNHDLACIVTPVGYMFVDNTIGQVFLFKNNLKLLNGGLNTFFRKYLRITEHNPYIGNGISINYDPDFNRVLVTVKNRTVTINANNIVPNYQETPAFFSGLTANQSIVYRQGSWQLFKGVNTTIYNCPSVPAGPTISNAAFTIPETSLAGTTVGILTTTANSTLTYLILSGNTGGAFRISPSGSLLVSASVLNHDITPVYTLSVQVVDIFGQTATASVTVNITLVAKPPVAPDEIVTIPEGSPNGTAVTTVIATDPRSLTLTYNILSGNSLGAFSLNSATGAILVADATQLVFLNNKQFVLVVQVTNSASQSTTCKVTINVIYGIAPTFPGNTVTIVDTVAAGAVIMNNVAATDPTAAYAGRVLFYQLVYESTPGAFIIDMDPSSATFLQITLAVGTVLIPSTVYTMIVAAIDPGPGTGSVITDATYTINVIAPFQNTAASGSFTRNNCPDGFVPSAVTYTVAAGTYFSNISQADADSKAAADIAANGQNYANANGTCTIATVYYYTRTADFQKNDCTSPNVGSTVTFSKTYSSFISVLDAQSIAAADSTFSSQGQAYANTNGTCVAPPPSAAVGIVVVDIFSAPNANLTGSVYTTGTTPYLQPVYTGLNFYPNDGTSAANCWMLASDIITVGSLSWRFEFNVARLLNNYPSATSFIFKITGRNNMAGTISGAYSLKGASSGNMTMSGSPGTYIPSTASSVALGIVNYTGKAIGAGADGTHGIGVGADILVFTYDVATKTLTLA